MAPSAPSSARVTRTTQSCKLCQKIKSCRVVPLTLFQLSSMDRRVLLQTRILWQSLPSTMSHLVSRAWVQKYMHVSKFCVL